MVTYSTVKITIIGLLMSELLADTNIVASLDKERS